MSAAKSLVSTRQSQAIREEVTELDSRFQSIWQKIAHDLIDHGRVRRAFLGVTLSAEYDVHKARRLGMKRFVGALVTRVSTGSPAHQAGISTNDLILEFNNIEVKDDAHLVHLVSKSATGKSLPVVVRRNGQRLKLSAVIRTR